MGFLIWIFLSQSLFAMDRPVGTKVLKDCSGWLATEFGRDPDEDGVVTEKVKVSVRTLKAAHRNAIIAWTTDEYGYGYWVDPAERGVLIFSQLKIPRRDRQYIQSTLANNPYDIIWDGNLDEVISKCATVTRRNWIDPKLRVEHVNGPWITDHLREVYCEAAKTGNARSIEARRKSDGVLVAGIYGFSVDGMFSAESMFHEESNVSKLLLYKLIERLESKGHWFLDVQEVKDKITQKKLANPLTSKWGGVRVSREDYLKMLREAQARNLEF